MSTLFPRFLQDESEYADAEAYWVRLWNSIPELERQHGHWRPGWFEKQPPKDGNPIFTAVSEIQQKGIRIIQYESVSNSDSAEIDFWLDTFGGDPADPDAIYELVIACALSIPSSQIAIQLMSSWIIGDIEVANTSTWPQALPRIAATTPRWKERTLDTDFDELTPAA